jgi:C4-dicarboxylate transporter, DctM subunit
LNLFISSFRFNRPVASLYRLVMPFVGILTFGLALVTYVPWFSNVAIAGDVAAARAKAANEGMPPRDAWMMQCVQEDPTNPQPCTAADRAAFSEATLAAPAGGGTGGTTDDTNPNGGIDAGCNPDFDDCSDAGTR